MILGIRRLNRTPHRLARGEAHASPHPHRELHHPTAYTESLRVTHRLGTAHGSAEGDVPLRPSLPLITDPLAKRTCTGDLRPSATEDASLPDRSVASHQGSY
jgi:hypothetical protein